MGRINLRSQLGGLSSGISLSRDSFNVIYAPTNAAEFCTAWTAARDGDLIDLRGVSGGTWDIEAECGERTTQYAFAIFGNPSNPVTLRGRFMALDAAAPAGPQKSIQWKDFNIDTTGVPALSSGLFDSSVGIGFSGSFSNMEITGSGGTVGAVVENRVEGTLGIVDFTHTDVTVTNADKTAFSTSASNGVLTTLNVRQSLVRWVNCVSDGRGSGANDAGFTVSNLQAVGTDCEVTGGTGSVAVVQGSETLMVMEGLNHHTDTGYVSCSILKRSATRASEISYSGTSYPVSGGIVALGNALSSYSTVWDAVVVDGGTASSGNWSCGRTASAGAANLGGHHMQGCQLSEQAPSGKFNCFRVASTSAPPFVTALNCSIRSGGTAANKFTTQSLASLDTTIYNCILSQTGGASIRNNATAGTWDYDYNVRNTLTGNDEPAAANDIIVAIGGADINASDVPTSGGNCDGTGTDVTANYITGDHQPFPDNDFTVNFQGLDINGDAYDLSSPNIGPVQSVV